ncbi:hypothetical protein P4S72_04695 [Vibrio sp. PP-XX7]
MKRAAYKGKQGFKIYKIILFGSYARQPDAQGARRGCMTRRTVISAITIFW